MWAGIVSAASFAYTLLKLGVKYGPEVVELAKTAIAFVKRMQDKIEENKRHGMADKAQETKNPDAIEDYLRGTSGS